MSTNQGRRGIIVGLFVLVGIGILLATIFTLGGQKKTFSNGIPVHAVFDNVNGLQAGNNIWFSGVKVGTVRRLQLLNGALVEVDMSIDPKSQPFIHKDAKVKIGSDGLIGNKIIVIYGGTGTAGPVQPHDTLQFMDEGGTAQMMSTLQSNNQNLLAITTDLKEISKRLASGQGTIGKLLTDDA
ncbi:MAG TPA: MlaD family protein, partial [Chitinophagaceae bacterium]